MAYVDYEFYQKSFFGNVVPESDFMRMSERASDFIDGLTFDRMADGLPSDDRQQKRIKKAICAVAEALYQIDIAEKNALSAAIGTSISIPGGGTATGIVTSVSSGSESKSYATPQQMGASAKEWSAVYAAAGDAQKTNDLLLKIALPLLMGVRTDEGIPILYAGFQG